MTFVVTENCIRCKYTDCVDVCPVDCFREGPNFLVIDPDECIDCAVCVPECPANAIYAEEDVPGDGIICRDGDNGRQREVIQQQITSLIAEFLQSPIDKEGSL